MPANGRWDLIQRLGLKGPILDVYDHDHDHDDDFLNIFTQFKNF